jgi:hypothetical protein
MCQKVNLGYSGGMGIVCCVMVYRVGCDMSGCMVLYVMCGVQCAICVVCEYVQCMIVQVCAVYDCASVRLRKNIIWCVWCVVYAGECAPDMVVWKVILRYSD